MHVDLNSIKKINDFVNIVSKYDDNIDLVSGRYVVNAKSILGVFSLDLSKPLKVEFYGSKSEEQIKQMLSKFEAVSC
ncbi:HPr family phosphocarrier protein [[Clostridium] fimetarium]|uniref:PTS HPr component phosphorylation site n=1 Tax=[Clostridium] fimetarium TaxID=99656 RepID=A0A1I0RMF8_9FIRM|nr:HPr family phosphocarrier protein [[Clostridium] fimetarium]SEW42353.1 PTS HPr component phosphorylation site [[Clostridium] fimetarium]